MAYRRPQLDSKKSLKEVPSLPRSAVEIPRPEISVEDIRTGGRGLEDRARLLKAHAEHLLNLRLGRASVELMKKRQLARLKSGLSGDRELFDQLFESARAAHGKLPTLRKSGEAAVTLHQKVIFTEGYQLLTDENVAMDSPADDAKVNALFADFGERFRRCKNKEDRRRLIALFKKQKKLRGKSDAEITATLADIALQTHHNELVLHVFKDERAASLFMQKSQEQEDSAQAFLQAIEASPELREEYRQYLRTWQQPHFADIFPPSAGGAHVEHAQPGSFDAASFESTGIALHLSGDNPEIHFGNTLTRRAAVFLVDGKPRLFIYDRNADTGVVGPLEPKADLVRTALGLIAIDEHFSESFRDFVPAGIGENDPTAVPDTFVSQITERFLPTKAGLPLEQLQPDDLRLVENIARLLTTPVSSNSAYLTLYSRVKFLQQRVLLDTDAKIQSTKVFLLKQFDSTNPFPSFDEFAQRVS